jgi:hypothetical protein
MQQAGIMTNQIREVIIPKEDAVFWLDKAGCWRNVGGKFRNKKVIDYFHAAIGKDDAGYFVSHVRDDVLEKVYFRHEDTALFVLDVLIDETITLVLNTGKKIPLAPDNLYTRNDYLYTLDNNEPVKFSERMMMRLSSLIIEKNGLLFLDWNGNTYKISEKKET